MPLDISESDPRGHCCFEIPPVNLQQKGKKVCIEISVKHESWFACIEYEKWLILCYFYFSVSYCTHEVEKTKAFTQRRLPCF